MTLNIKGIYSFRIPITTMFLNTEIVIKGTNLITFLGESFFLERCVNDSMKPIEYIAIGNGVKPPMKKDETLGNETKRETVGTYVDMNTKQLILTSRFQVENLIGITEIGVIASEIDKGEFLVSHDTFYETILNEEFLYGVVGSVQVQYIFQFSTSQIKTGWKKATGYNNTYYAYEPNMIKSVMDNTKHYGLSKAENIRDVDASRNSYYHDVTDTHNLYVHLYHESGDVAPNPNDYEIIIENN